MQANFLKSEKNWFLFKIKVFRNKFLRKYLLREFGVFFQFGQKSAKTTKTNFCKIFLLCVKQSTLTLF